MLIHVGALNLSLVMRKLWGKGTPRGWQGYSADALLAFLQFWMAILAQAEELVAFQTPQVPEQPVQLAIFILLAAE